MEGCVSVPALLLAIVALAVASRRGSRLQQLERRVAELEKAAQPALIATENAIESTERPAVEPAPIVPAPIEPAPIEPAPIEPAPIEPQPRASIEELLGTQIFLKAGVAIVVVGMVLFLGYALTAMGPAGRVATGLVVGAGLLAGGLFAERRESYRTFGRALVAGGWSVLYFVAFAAHFLPAAQVIESRSVGSLLLFGTAAAAVAFSLRYRNEWTTTGAFLLIFLALTVAGLELEVTFNLVAAGIVAVGLALLAWRLGWARLLGLGVPATWLALAVALLPYSAELARGRDLGIEAGVLAALAVVWAVFQATLLTAPEAGDEQASRVGWHALAYLANLAGAFGLAADYLHAVAPGTGWLVALAAAALYLPSAGLLHRRGRPVLYRLSIAAAMAALALAPPLYLGLRNVWLPILWLLTFEIALVAAVLLRERWLRVLAYLGFAAAFVEVAVLRGLEGVFAEGARPALLAATAALALLDAWLLLRPWRELVGRREAALASAYFSTAGAAFTLLLLWTEAGRPWSAPLVAAAGCAWIWAARRARLRAFLWQGSALLLAGAWLVATRSWWLEGEALGWSIRSLSTLGAIAAFFGARFALEHLHWPAARGPRPFLLLLPTTLLALLAHGDAVAFERPELAPALWGLAGALYFEVGRWRRSRGWWYLAHAWLLGATVHLHASVFGESVSAAWRNGCTVLIVALLIWGYAAWRRCDPGAAPGPLEPLRHLYLVGAAGTLARLLAVLVSGTGLTLALGIEGLVAVALGFLLRLRSLRWIGLGLLSFCIFKLFLYDLSGLTGLARIASFIVLGAILIAVSWAYTRFRGKLDDLV